MGVSAASLKRLHHGMYTECKTKAKFSWEHHSPGTASLCWSQSDCHRWVIEYGSEIPHALLQGISSGAGATHALQRDLDRWLDPGLQSNGFLQYVWEWRSVSLFIVWKETPNNLLYCFGLLSFKKIKFGNFDGPWESRGWYLDYLKHF